ncbi:MAG: SusC/RagA family TonB-linked outer membrane protein [Bacteroidales bacterium]
MRKLFMILLCIQISTVLYAQQKIITGTVFNDNETLVGVHVIVEGTVNGNVTDENGNFKLAVNKGDVLVVSFIGYKTRKITVGDENGYDIRLLQDINSVEQVMVVGYGETTREINTGAVSAINAGKLQTIPTSSVQNTLAGRLPGFFSQQRGGQPGRDASDFFIRGASSLNGDNQPLIIVDDVQYTYEQLSQINVNEIESISILKDASTTAIYGIKGANGVLVVKTKRGVRGRPHINVRLEGGLQTPVRTPEFLNSYETAQLVNEAYINDGLSTIFTAEDIEHFRVGDDPYGHPDVNWYETLFKKVAFQENANVDVSGGTDKLRYFFSGGAFLQNGLLRSFRDKYTETDNEYNYTRFNYRSNIDFDLTTTTRLRFDITTRIGDINEPAGQNVVGEIYNFERIHPYSAPVLNPNGSYAYASDIDGGLPTPNARIANYGYKRTRRIDNNFLFQVNQKLDFITKGLDAMARVAYSNINESNRSMFRASPFLANNFPAYKYNPETDTYAIRPGSNYDFGNYMLFGEQGTFYRDLNIQAYINYRRQFGGVHNVNGMFIYNMNSSQSKGDVPSNFQSYTGKISYNYNEKYMIDFSAAVNGTDRFGAGSRYGFFPAVGVSWNISSEPFFQGMFSNVQLLKLRASYGLVGSDAAGGDRYLYTQYYTPNDGGYLFGENPTGYQTISEGALANANVTWEKNRKFNVGLDANLFNDKLSLTIDYFYDKRYDQLVAAKDVPNIIGVELPQLNLAETQNTGFDGKIGYMADLGRGWQLNTEFVFSYAKNKILYQSEAEQRYPWLQTTGHPINQPLGYVYQGFYSKDDIATLNDPNPLNDVAVPDSDVPVQAGDLKYADLDGNGVINEYDRSAIAKPNLPTTTLGLNLGLYYKGFSMSILLQGAFDYSFSVTGTGIEPFQSQFQPIHRDRWTEATAATASFPRLTSNPTTVNSSANYMSDFWLVDAWYVRLKTIDIGYQFPEKMVPFGLSSMRWYVSAYNPLTITSYDKYQQDPEISTNTAGDAYMNQRVFNLGVQITL